MVVTCIYQGEQVYYNKRDASSQIIEFLCLEGRTKYPRDPVNGEGQYNCADEGCLPRVEALDLEAHRCRKLHNTNTAC